MQNKEVGPTSGPWWGVIRQQTPVEDVGDVVDKAESIKPGLAAQQGARRGAIPSPESCALGLLVGTV